MFDIATTLGGQLTDSTERAFTMGLKEVPEGGRQIFNPEPTDKYTEVFNSAVTDPAASRTSDGGVFYLVTPIQGDSLTLTQYKVTVSMEVTEMEMHFDKYGVTPKLLSVAQGIGSGLMVAQELDTQQFVKNGTATNYTDRDGNLISTTGADALALFSASHTINANSSTFSNTNSTAFGQTGMEQHLDFFRKFLNHDGIRVNRRPNAIFSSRKAAVTRLISEYAVSQGQPETQLLGDNTYRGRFTHIPLEYLDTNSSRGADTATENYWGLCVRNGPNMKLRISKPPDLMAPEKVLRTNNWLIKGQTWYAVGVYESTDISMANA